MAVSMMNATGLQTRSARLTAIPAGRRVQMRKPASFVVRAEGKQLREKDSIPGAPGVGVEDKGEKDSYQQLEMPVRSNQQNPIDGRGPVPDRRDGRDDLYIQTDGSAEREILGQAVSFPNLMRFNGAAPEVINSRLAMLGATAAIAAELSTHTTVFEQFAKTPGPIIGVFVLFSIASLIPMLKGVPRYGGEKWGSLKAFSPDAEILVGRTAMLGFLGIVLNEYITKTSAL